MCERHFFSRILNVSLRLGFAIFKKLFTPISVSYDLCFSFFAIQLFSFHKIHHHLFLPDWGHWWCALIRPRTFRSICCSDCRHYALPLYDSKIDSRPKWFHTRDELNIFDCIRCLSVLYLVSDFNESSSLNNEWMNEWLVFWTPYDITKDYNYYGLRKWIMWKFQRKERTCLNQHKNE